MGRGAEAASPEQWEEHRCRVKAEVGPQSGRVEPGHQHPEQETPKASVSPSGKWG